MRVLTGSRPLDHPLQIVIADGLAVLAHRDHGLVDDGPFLGGQDQSELLRAALDRKAAGLLATASPRSSWQCVLKTARSEFGTRLRISAKKSRSSSGTV